MPTNVRTDNKDLVTQHARGTVTQPVDPVLLEPSGAPGVATHTNSSATIRNAAGTVFNRGTLVAHRGSYLGAGRHTPDVRAGQNVPIRDGDNGFLSWAKDLYIEGQQAVMHHVETGVNALWSLLPPEVKNILQNGEAVVSGLTADDFVDAAREESQAMLDALMSKDTLIALLQTAVLMGLAAVPVVGQLAAGAATALRIKAAIESAAGAAQELKAILEQWSKPMSPAQLAAARKKLASFLLRVGISALLAALGKAVPKVRRRTQGRHNSQERVEVGEGPAARATDCPCAVGSPVIVAVGEKQLSAVDFDLPGHVPIEWARSYRSGDVRDGWFGQGWSHPLAVELVLGADGHVYHDAQGRRVDLPVLPVGGEHRDAYEQLTFRRPAEDVWHVVKGESIRVFERPREDLFRLPLSALLDHHGNRVTLRYPPPPEEPLTVARPAAILDSVGRVLELAWDERAHLISVTLKLPAGRATHSMSPDGSPLALARYSYSPEGDLAAVTDAAGVRRTYTFRSHVLVGYTEGNGARFAAEYDVCAPWGRVVRSWSEDTGEGLTFQYDDRGRRTHVTDALGRRTTFEYDERRDIVATVGPDGARTETPFNANGLPRGKKDPLGRETHFQFDARGNLTTVIDASGARTKVEYDDRDLPVRLTDAMGSVWRREYDEQGDLAAVTDPMGHVTRYVRDERGQLVQKTDALGQVTRLEWDEMGNLVCERLEGTGATRFEHDALGRVVRQVDALGHVTTFTYDGVGNLLERREPGGAVHRYRWDGEGNLLEHRDASGGVTAYRYDPLGRLVERTDAAGRTLRYEHDTGGRVVALVNENGAVMRFSYDVNDAVVEEVGFDGRVQRYVHDAGGDLVQRIEVGTGVITHFTRDAAGRVVEKRAGGDESAGARYTYDALGRLIAAENPAATVTFTYDALGRLLTETQTLDGMDPRTLTHRRDALGRRTATTLPDGRTEHFTRDAAGWLKQLGLEDQGQVRTIVEVERDALQQEVKRTQGPLESLFEHDPMSRLVRHRAVIRGRASGAREVASSIERVYRYDPGDDLLERIDSLRGATEYTYDPTARILSARAASTGESETFRFDPAGNLVDVAEDVIHDNRLRRLGGLRYAHDVEGNVVTRMRSEEERMELTWTAHRMLRKAVVHRAGVTQTTTYEYDALGRRTRKRDAFGSTVYLWDGHRMIESRRGRRAALFVFEPDSLIPLATAQNGQIYWYQTDHLGTPLELTDEEGRIVWAADYRAWGEAVLRRTGTGGDSHAAAAAGRPAVLPPIEQPFRLPGQQHDEETGLHYSRFRYYDPAIGRFLSQDPLGLEGGENFFVYGPNPTGWIDPFGLAKRKGKKPKKKDDGGGGQQEGRRPHRDGSECKCDKFTLPKADRRCTGPMRGLKRKVTIFRDAVTGIWYSEDRAKHGGSMWKQFAESAGGVDWEADLDEYGHVHAKNRGGAGLRGEFKDMKCYDL